MTIASAHDMKPAYAIVTAVIAGVALRAVVGLEPLWWLAWLAPAPLLVLACRSTPMTARLCVALAALIGTSVNLPYFGKVMPLPAAWLVVTLQALSWVLIIMAARRIVLHYRAWWTVFAYPLLWAAADMLMASVLPDGNWGSLGYTQAGFLPALQLASLAGVPALVFMLSLIASALALPFAPGIRQPGRAGVMAALALLAVLTFGYARLADIPAPGPTVAVGIVAIDDYIGAHTPPADAQAVLSQYDRHIVALAHRGAQLVLMPEKIMVATPAQAARLQRHYAALASELKISIVAGMGIDDGARRTNMAWLLSPDGRLAANYQKHFVAPPEREFVAGHAYALQAVEGASMGLAICKDMHFASLGRAYGQRNAAVMLVPAWDFNDDANMALAVTLTRGVESGFTIVRAAREGLLSVSDPYGRIVANQRSAASPGSAMLTRVAVTRPAPTFYSRTGPIFGWLCVALAAALVVASYRTARRRQ